MDRGSATEKQRGAGRFDRVSPARSQLGRIDRLSRDLCPLLNTSFWFLPIIFVFPLDGTQCTKPDTLNPTYWEYIIPHTVKELKEKQK